MNESDGFITPPEHLKFLAKKLFGNCGEIIDGAIAYLEPNGGGPVKLHTHPHNHLFIVISGQAKVLLDKEAFLVKGEIPHSVWNNSQNTTVMLGISVK